MYIKELVKSYSVLSEWLDIVLGYKKMKFSFKLFSSNCLHTPEIAKKFINYLNDQEDMFFELMAIPDSYEETYQFYKDNLRVPVVIHNAHETFGFNTGDKSKRESNRKMLDESSRFADALGAEIIVTHAGNDFGVAGYEETIHQFCNFTDKRVAVENLPMYLNETKIVMHGLTPKEIKEIKAASGCKFCFDFAHAICAANALGNDIDATLKGFADLNPDMYHLCDGDITSTEDVHWHLGEGSFDIEKYLREYTKPDGIVTMEVGGRPDSIEPWINDYKYVKNLLK